MNVGILASEGSWYFRDLDRAARSMGHMCERLDFARLVAKVDSQSSTFRCQSDTQIDRGETSKSNPCLSANGDFPIQDPLNAREANSRHEAALTQKAVRPLFEAKSHEVIIVRTMPPGSLEQVVYRMDVLAQLEAAGTRVINSPKSLECAVDKYLTTAKLQRAGLPVPATIVCEHEDDAQEAFERLGRDIVVKPLFGSEGRGIVRVSDPDLAHRTFRTLMRLDSVLYLQRFIDHGGCDVRILVLDGQVLGGMRRRSPHDFRTNVAREAIAEAHEPTSNEVDLALRATSTTGAFIAGIDLLYDRDGTCYVVEVNAVPGWQAFGRVTGIDVAKQLIARLQPNSLVPKLPLGNASL